MAGIDAVLPLRARDYERARMLIASLGEFFSCGTVVIVVPDEAVSQIETRLSQETFPKPPLQVVAERVVVPEFMRFRRMRGWYKQQLIKLAVADVVSSDFYITLDADVICTRPVTTAQMLTDDKAPCHIEPADLHPDWYRSSRRVLGYGDAHRRVSHNVTPAVLARAAVQALGRSLDERVRKGAFSGGLLGVRQRLALRRVPRSHVLWRTFLAASVPWTEYALYYSFLEESGVFDQYHVASPTALYASGDGSIWRGNKSQFDGWNPDSLFGGEGPPFFVIVQSNAALPVEAVREKFVSNLPVLNSLAVHEPAHETSVR